MRNCLTCQHLCVNKEKHTKSCLIGNDDTLDDFFNARLTINEKIAMVCCDIDVDKVLKKDKDTTVNEIVQKLKLNKKAYV